MMEKEQVEEVMKWLAEQVKQVKFNKSCWCTHNVWQSHLKSYSYTHVAPGEVTFNVTELTSTAVVVKWSPPLQPNGVITAYEVAYQSYKNDNNIIYRANLKNIVRSYTISKLSEQ